MINHVRTLLLNSDYGALPESGDEYVPSYARRRELSRRLQTIREALFGASPDRLFLNYRLYLLSLALHESSLSAYMTATDGRLTYLRERNRLPGAFPMDVFGISQTALASADAIVAQTDSVGVDVAGVCRQTLRLSLTDTDGVWTWLRNRQPPVTLAKPTAQSGLLSFDVPSGGYSVSVPDEEGSAWIFDIAYRPQFTLVEVANNVEQVSAAVTAEMFGGTRAAVPPMPYADFLRIWNEPLLPFDRLSAAALTLAYRTGELP